MNTPVSFELAELLKKKGFEKKGYLQDVWLGDKYEGKHPKVKKIPVFGLGSTSILPTVSEAVMWLYEKHNIWISVKQNSFIGGGKSSFISNVKRTEYNSPTEAYEAAVKYVLENLISNVNK